MLKLRKILLCNYPFYILLFITIILTIVRLSIPKESLYSETSKSFTGIVTNIKENERVTLYIKNKETIIAKTNKSIENISLGDKITVYGNFTRPTNNTNENLFNYKKYLYKKNIFYQVKITKIIKIKSNKNIYYSIKKILIKRLNKNKYLHTFILGDKTYINSDVVKSYQTNGISHLFAISGMHITLLSSIIDKILKKIKVQEEKRYIVITIVLLIYLFLVGLSPSILRGVLFYILFKLNNIKYFYINPINLFFLTLSISLLVNPYYIYDVGYQYSYLISFSLLKLSKTLQEKNYLKSLLKVSILSFFVSLPITLYNFSQINLLSIIYNLLFVPLVSIIIFPLSLISTIIQPLIPLLNISTKILELLSLSLSKITLGIIIFKRISIIFYFIYLMLIISYLYTKKRLLIISVLVLLVIHYLIPYFDSTNYVNILDVGQGDCILLKDKNKSILIDTGGNKDYEVNIANNIIIPTLKYQGIKKINYLILTHGH